jgi:phosphoribosylanthranilate isomerase
MVALATTVLCMFVKICGVTSEDDALLAVALGADAIGFIFAPSSRQIAVQKVYDITRRLPPEILTVGVFKDAHPSRVVEMVQSSGVKAAQLHGHESPDDVLAISKHVRFVIKAVTAGTVDASRADEFNTDYILVDSASPGSGQVFDWSLVVNVPEVPKLILAGGLTPDNVAEAITAVKPWGVDVASGVEASPGKKDPLAMKRFIETAKSAAPEPHRGPDTMPYDWTDE